MNEKECKITLKSEINNLLVRNMEKIKPYLAKIKEAEKEINTLESRKEELERQLADPELYKDQEIFSEKSKEYAMVERRLARFYQQWEVNHPERIENVFGTQSQPVGYFQPQVAQGRFCFFLFSGDDQYQVACFFPEKESESRYPVLKGERSYCKIFVI